MSKLGLKFTRVGFWLRGFIGRCSSDAYLLLSIAELLRDPLEVAGRGGGWCREETVPEEGEMGGWACRSGAVTGRRRTTGLAGTLKGR